jgi:NAD(P)-dependent dehydrogenase (short-subunit alcohol dehydrogenase family)
MSTAHGGAGGAIVNVSSAASRLGSPGEYVDYAASKGAMDTLTTGLSVEVAREGIRVNAVRPGFIRTTMHADGGEPGRVDRLQHLLPMGRGGEPEEVAEAVVWLLSEAASFVTGSFIDLAGGKEVRLNPQSLWRHDGHPHDLDSRDDASRRPGRARPARRLGDP